MTIFKKLKSVVAKYLYELILVEHKNRLLKLLPPLE